MTAQNWPSPSLEGSRHFRAEGAGSAVPRLPGRNRVPWAASVEKVHLCAGLGLDQTHEPVPGRSGCSVLGPWGVRTSLPATVTNVFTCRNSRGS